MAEKCGSVARNKKQVANIKSTSAMSSGEHDSLYAIIEQYKREEMQCDPFIWCVQGAPDVMCVLAIDRQLHDSVRFCCNPREFCILGTDPTFNLGDFSLTVTTYWYLQLVNRKTIKPPVMIGPMLVHQRKTTQSYHFLSSNIVGFCQKLATLQAFGTDGEIALADAFQLQFKSAVHLVCFPYVKDFIVQKLRDIGIDKASSDTFLEDIFGFGIQQGTHLYTGLVDGENSVPGI